MGQAKDDRDENGRFAARIAKVDELNKQADFFNSRNFKQNLALSQEAYALAVIEPIYLLGMAAARLHSAYANFYFDQYEMAQQQLFDALLIYEEQNDWRGQAACHTMLGTIQWRLANYSVAAIHQEKAVSFVERVTDPDLGQYILINLGLLYTGTESYEDAIAAYEFILEKYQNNINSFFQNIIFNNLTMFHFHANNLEEAHDWGLKSLAMAEQFDDRLLRSTVLDSLGTVLLAKQQAEMALAYFEESEVLARGVDFKSNCAVALLNKGRAHQQLNENEQATDSWQEALALSSEIGLREQERQAHQLLADFYKQQGDFGQALDHFEKFHQIDKAIIQDTAELKLKTLHLSHEVEIAKAQNQILRQAMVEQQAVEAALRKSETRFRTVVENMPVMIDAFDENQNIVFWNKECERVTGYSAAEVVNNPQVASLLYPDPDYLNQMMARWQEYAGKEFYHFEWDITCKDGSQRTVSWSSISPSFAFDGWVNWNIGIDVTDRQRAEAALRYAQKMESLGILAGGIAHDFNNLLVSILGHMSLAVTKLPSHHTAQTHLQKAIAASEKAANLTQKMLAYSGRGHFSVEPLQLNQTVQETVLLLQNSWPDEVELLLELEEDLPFIAADKGQMQQVVRNLMLNGAEAIFGGEAGQVVVQTTAVFLHVADVDLWKQIVGQSVSPGRYVSLTVTDSGSGIELLQTSNIFDPFYTTKHPPHHGLGLAAVLGIVRGHEGGIKLISEPNDGTTVEIIFPTAAEPTPADEPKTAVLASSSGSKILIIDDQQAVLEAISDILELEGYASLLATRGQEGIELFREQADEIKLVILDLSMPGLSGEETFRQLRQIQPSLPILFSSGYDRKMMRNGIPNDPNVAFIQKPYQFQSFIEKVKQLIQ